MNETKQPAVGPRLEAPVRRAAKALLNAYVIVGWCVSGALMFWLPFVYVPFDMRRHKMTFLDSVRFEYRMFWRTMQCDRPRA